MRISVDNNINQKNNKFKQIFRYQFVYVALLILMAAAVIMNINTGNVHISPVQIGKIIFLKGDSGTPEYNIIWKIRLPRLCMAAILGGALSLSGFLLQTFFRNPIAGPFVLGISSGAKMFVAITMIFLLEHVSGMPLWAQVAAAFVGSLFAMLYVLFFANKVKSMSMLLVVGIMISYICSAIT
ncbi:MAG TPA: iron ABC transporter permease, partial [Eubacterium sp.]|nr:iron ABC transporter permease [Eubacterium sp.]